MKMKAGLLLGYNEPIAIEEIELLPPQQGEILVKYEASGICHSDMSRVKGKYKSALPLVLGHEAAGMVVEVGTGVKDLKPGDRVILSVMYNCGRCFYCSIGDWHLCKVSNQLIVNGTMPDGTTRLRRANGEIVYHHVISSYAQYGVVPANNAIKIPDEMSLLTASALGCGVLTGVGAVFNKAKVKPGSTCAVIGVGGVGLNVIQACNISGASKIIAVDIHSDKLEYARQFGATHTINATEIDAVAAVKELTSGEGVDYSFEAVGMLATMRQAYDCTRRGGTCTIVGIASDSAELTISAFGILWGDKTLQGAFAPYHSQRDIPLLCDLYLAGKLKLDELISKHYKLEEINESFDDMANGRIARGLIIH